MADGMWSAIGSGLGSIIGGLSKKAGPDYNSIYGDIDIPALEELIKAGQIDGTAYDQISEDPATRSAQVDALNAMLNEGNRNGASIQSQAAIGQILDRTATADAMNREAVMQDMARRGQLGGAQEMAARLMGQQQNARTAALQGTQVAADDRNRALQAMVQAGQLGGNIRGQDYTIAANRANARDALAKWNAQNRTQAYNDRQQWQYQRAAGRAGLAPQQYNRTVGMGGAIGGLAGGAMDYWNSRPKTGGEQEKANGPGYDWNAKETDTAGGYDPSGY